LGTDSNAPQETKEARHSMAVRFKTPRQQDILDGLRNNTHLRKDRALLDVIRKKGAPDRTIISSTGFLDWF